MRKVRSVTIDVKKSAQRKSGVDPSRGLPNKEKCFFPSFSKKKNEASFPERRLSKKKPISSRVLKTTAVGFKL